MNLLLALLSGLLLVLIHPRFDLPWLAPFALTPLLAALSREPRPKHRFLLGYIAGIVFWTGVCYWIQAVLAVHGAMGELGGGATFALFVLAKALHFGVFGLLAAVLVSRSYAVPAVAALWAGLERTQGPVNGFEWLALGNAGADMGLPMRLAPITGVYGLSFVFAAMATGVALVILRRPRKHLAWFAMLLGLPLMPELAAASKGGSGTAVLVQPNVAADQEWSQEAADMLERRLITRSLETALAAGGSPPDFVVWPELPAPIYYETDAGLRGRVAGLARAARASILFGSVGYTRSGAPLNSAQMVSPEGNPIARYDKIYLVPFGEYVPPLFGFVNRITKEAGDFVPGEKIVLFPAAGHTLGAFICYESAVPRHVREFARKGGEVLVNLSNDGYFFRTAAREQHLKLVRMRAAENRRWILRATNNGITAVIDPAGRVLSVMPPFQDRAALVRFDYIGGQTFYTRVGDWFAWLCLAGAAAALFLSQLPHYTPAPTRAGSEARRRP